MKYRKGYKYQLAEDEYCKTGICPNEHIDTEFITLGIVGDLRIKKGYAWDGPSGPTIDTKNFMRPALVHDALYQLMRGSFLPKSKRGLIDELLHIMCLGNKMNKIRAWYVYRSVRKLAGFAADPKSKKKVYEAP